MVGPLSSEQLLPARGLVVGTACTAAGFCASSAATGSGDKAASELLVVVDHRFVVERFRG